MRIRTLKSLYEILWKEIKDKNTIVSLCGEINELWEKSLISHNEWKLLFYDFESQFDKHSEFMTKEKNWSFQFNSGCFWWNAKEAENPVNRKAFIEKIISTL